MIFVQAPEHETMTRVVELLVEIVRVLKQSELLPKLLVATYWRGFTEGAIAGALAACIGVWVYHNWGSKK